MLIRLLTSVDELEQIRGDWLALHQTAGRTLFSHPAWICHFYRHYPPDDIVVYAAFDDDKSLVAVVPLAIREFKIAGIAYRAIQHAGFDSADYADMLIATSANPRRVIHRVLKALAELQSPAWELLHIDNISDADAVGKLFMALAQRQFYSLRVAGIATPAIDFAAPFAENRKIANIRRNMQRATATPGLEIRRGAEIRLADLQRLTVLNRAALPQAEFHSERAQGFYQALLKDPDFGDHCELAVLRLDEDMVAGHFGFADGRSYYYYVPAFDTVAAEFGPGQYLLWQLIEQARERGLGKFDLLRGAEPYKFDWANRVDRNHSLLATRAGAPLSRRLLLNLWAARRSLPLFGGPGNSC